MEETVEVKSKKAQTSALNIAKGREKKLAKQREATALREKEKEEAILKKYEKIPTKDFVDDESSSSEDEVIIFNPRKTKMKVAKEEKVNPFQSELLELRKQLSEMSTKVNTPIPVATPIVEVKKQDELSQHLKMKILNF